MTKREITQLSYAITGCAIKVHKALGPGLLESIYEKCLKYELQKSGFNVKQQLTIPVFYDDLQINTNLKLDLFVNDLVVIELKTVETILPVHEAQLLTYMKLLEAPQRLLFNFFTDNIVRSMKPFVNDYFRILAD
jgi:GxxExxY protein